MQGGQAAFEPGITRTLAGQLLVEVPARRRAATIGPRSRRHLAAHDIDQSPNYSGQDKPSWTRVQVPVPRGPPHDTDGGAR
jgi:hypothetical protein